MKRFQFLFVIRGISILKNVKKSQLALSLTTGGKKSDVVKDDCRYLKDWNSQYNAYTTPSYFCSDWLNEWWELKTDSEYRNDYRFVYIGPKNSWTPFHADVFGSFSWSANIVGKKRWIFFPPGEEIKLK